MIRSKDHDPAGWAVASPFSIPREVRSRLISIVK